MGERKEKRKIREREILIRVKEARQKNGNERIVTTVRHVENSIKNYTYFYAQWTYILHFILHEFGHV